MSCPWSPHRCGAVLWAPLSSGKLNSQKRWMNRRDRFVTKYLENCKGIFASRIKLLFFFLRRWGLDGLKLNFLMIWNWGTNWLRPQVQNMHVLVLLKMNWGRRTNWFSQSTNWIPIDESKSTKIGKTWTKQFYVAGKNDFERVLDPNARTLMCSLMNNNNYVR